MKTENILFLNKTRNVLKEILILSCVILICGCSTSKSNKSIEVNYEELRSGAFTAKTVYTEQLNNSEGWERRRSDDLKQIDQSTNIKGEIGKQFGVEYILKSNVTTDIIVDQVWIFPTEIQNDKGETLKELRYQAKKPTNKEIYSLYSLEYDFEVVEGEWVFQIFYEGKKLGEKRFIIE